MSQTSGAIPRPQPSIVGAHSNRGEQFARDRILMANGCQMTSKPWNAAFPGCVIYDGCMPDYPVVWCLTMGQGHSTGGINSSKGFWTFWSTLPKLP